MFYDAAKRDHGLPQDPLKSLIVPRPIGWISTVDRQGRVNLAPYSFYNAVSEFPPIVCFAITGTYGSTPTKHSRMNAESTGEFVVNMVSESLKEQMNVTTTMVEFGVDELKLAGLTPEPSTMVKPPRVKESPVALECKYWRTIELPVDRGNPADRPRHDQRLQRVLRQAMIALGGIVEHGFLIQPICRLAFSWASSKAASSRGLSPRQDCTTSLAHTT